MITVKKSDRFGYTPGCWWISVNQAKRLCEGSLPQIGWERCVKEESGVVTTEGGVEFRVVFKAWVENVSGHFRLRDENHILGVSEAETLSPKR